MKFEQTLLSMMTVFLLLLSGLAGCLDDEGGNGDEETPEMVERPQWQLGHYWLYSFSTPEYDELVSKLVVAPNDGTNHHIGISTLKDAQRHAVLNFNPVLGRVEMENFSLYEKGELQQLFSFPLENGKIWSFSLLDVVGFSAQVTDIRSADLPMGGKTVLVDVVAVAPLGERLDYVYDLEAGWLRSFMFTDAMGLVLLEMTLVSFGDGFSGEVYFVRGKDLFDGDYSSPPPVVDVYDSFVDSGHENYGDFDNLIYYFDVVTGGDGAASINLKDHTEVSGHSQSFGPGSSEGSLGTVPSSSGNWTVNVDLEGSSYLRIRIAGGITYIWDV